MDDIAVEKLPINGFERSTKMIHYPRQSFLCIELTIIFICRNARIVLFRFIFACFVRLTFYPFAVKNHKTESLINGYYISLCLQLKTIFFFLLGVLCFYETDQSLYILDIDITYSSKKTRKLRVPGILFAMIITKKKKILKNHV